MSTSRLHLRADSSSQFGYFGMAGLAIYWGCLFLFSNLSTRNDNIKFLIITTGLAIGVSGWSWGRALADGMRVVAALPAPRSLWNAWLQEVVRNVSLRWGLAVLAGTIALSLDGATWCLSVPAFLYSAILTLSITASLSHHGVWHWAWSTGIALSIGLLIAVSNWHAADLFLQSPAIWQLPVALSWPLLAALLAWFWRGQPPSGVATRSRTQFNLWRSWTGYAKRYTALRPAFQRAQSKSGQQVPFFAATIPVIYLFAVRTLGLKAQWGGQAGLLYIGSLVLLAVFASAMLVCKDLHWRRVLAPDGFPRGRVGWHIIASTLTVVTLTVVFLAVCFGALFWSFASNGVRVPPADLLIAVAPYRTFPFELVLAVCVGVVIRGTRRPLITSSLVVLILLVVGAAAVGMLGMKTVFGLFAIGPSYLIGLQLAIVGAILLANRMWTTQRLLPYIVAGAQQINDE